MLLNCGVAEDSWESLGLQGDQTSQSERKSVLNIHWEDWCWSWNSNSLATWCKELTHWKRPQCWERVKAGGEGDDTEWDGWMASLTWWTSVIANSGSWWWTGRPGVLQSMRSQRVGHDWATELNWCGIFPNQGSNPCFLHWQVDSLPWNHSLPGEPLISFYRLNYLWSYYFLLPNISIYVFSCLLSPLQEFNFH